MTWNDVSIEKYQRYFSLCERLKDDENEYAFELVGLMYDMTANQVNSLSLIEFNSLLKGLSFLNEPPKEKPRKRFKVNGRWYRLQFDVRNIRASLISTSTALEAKGFSKDFPKNLHKLAASLVTPERVILGIHFSQKYKAENHEMIAEDMRDVPITILHSYCVFFWDLLPKLISTTLDYLSENSSEKMKQQVEQLVASWRTLDGCSMLSQLPSMKA